MPVMTSALLVPVTTVGDSARAAGPPQVHRPLPLVEPEGEWNA